MQLSVFIAALFTASLALGLLVPPVAADTAWGDTGVTVTHVLQLRAGHA